MTNQLIPVFAGEIQNQSVQLVDARLLHSFLEVARDFSTWIKDRIEEYGFVEGIDFLIPQKRGTKTGRGGDRRSIDYHLILDTAKELGMIERSEKGRQIRRYFIEMERIAHSTKYGLKSLPAPRAKKMVKGGLELQQQDAINDFIKQRLETLPQEKRGGMAQRIYAAINTKFGTKGLKYGYKNIAPEQFDNILQLIARLPLDEDQLLLVTAPELDALVQQRVNAKEGELLASPATELDALIDQRVKRILEGEIQAKADCPKYHYPMSDWKPHNRLGNSAWLTFTELFRVDPANRCTTRLFNQHKLEGDNVAGAEAEVTALYLILEAYGRLLMQMRLSLTDFDRKGLNISLNG